MKKFLFVFTCLFLIMQVVIADASEYEAPIVGNVSVYDSGGDDTFESVTSTSQIRVIWRNVSAQNQRYKIRGVIEVDLSAFPDESRVESALLKFYATSMSNRPEIQFWGYKGNGTAELTDSNKGDVLISSVVLDSTGGYEVELAPYVRELRHQGYRYLGLNVRASSEGMTNDTYDNEVIFNGYQSTSEVFYGVGLTLSDEPGELITPEDTICQHRFDWAYPDSVYGFNLQSSNSYGRFQVVNGYLRMDESSIFSNYTLNEIDWTADLEGASNVLLTFFQASHGDEIDGLPLTYTGSADGDGVAISSDGSTWYTIINAEDLDVGSRGDVFTVDLDAEVERIRDNYDPLFQYTNEFKLRFQQYDNYPFFTNDGRDWGNFLITGTPRDAYVDLELTQSDFPDEVDAGSELTYTLYYENNGGEKASGVVISGTLPQDVFVVNASPGCERVGNNFTCYVGNVEAGSSGAKEFVVTPKAEGVHNFTATISTQQTDDNDDNNTAGQDIEVLPMPNQPPVVMFLVNPYGIIVEGSLVQAELDYLYDPNITDTHSFSWDFGDGFIATGAGPVSHTYVDDGDYTITLTALDNSGLSGSSSQVISVSNADPLVEAGDDISSDMYSPVSFAGQYSDEGSLDTHTIEWDFGDGVQMSDTLTPVHTYTKPGTFVVTLTVSDHDGGVGEDSLTVTVLPVYSIGVSPSQPSEFHCIEGGTATPSCAVYTISNTSANPVDWTLTVSEDWIEASSHAGNLTADGTQDIEVCLTSSAPSLPAGDYIANVSFFETSSGLSVTRDIALTVLNTEGILPYEYFFSDGLPGDENGWTYNSSNPYGRIQVVNERLRMDVSQNGNFNLNEAVLSVDLEGASDVELSFFQADHGDELTVLPEQFNGHFNGDGVAISIDGNTWYRIINSSSLDVSSSGQNYSISLDETIQRIRSNFDPDFAYTSDVRLKFQQYDNYAYPSDGREWDTIQITGVKSSLKINPKELPEIPVPADHPTMTGCQPFNLTNTDTVTLNWTASTTDEWLTLNINQGELAPAETITADVCWDAIGFVSGESHTGIVEFSDSINGTQQRSLTLKMIGDTLRPPYTQDFTNGLPGIDDSWEYYSSNASTGRIEVQNGRLRMDVNTSGQFNLNEAVLTMDLTSLSNVELSFFHAESSDEIHSMDATFTGHMAADGVAVSMDNINWYRILNAGNLDVGSTGTTITVDLDAEIERIRTDYDANFAYTSEFRIKFQQYDNYSFSSDGRQWDDISITVTQ